jgi:shikimate kinase
MADSVVLIGMPGVGKTRTARLLAKLLYKDFLDLDRKIEEYCNVDIFTIFDIEHEEGFRRRENEELFRILNQCRNYVLSVGGGCMINNANKALLKRDHIFVVQLDASNEVLTSRLKNSINKRPLFIGISDVAGKLQEIYDTRKELYDEVSDLIVDTSDSDNDKVIRTIMARLRQRMVEPDTDD